MSTHSELETKHRVNTAVMTKTAAKVSIEGEDIDAEVPTFEVELISDEGHGSLVLRFKGSKAERARDWFTQGKTVVAAWGD